MTLYTTNSGVGQNITVLLCLGLAVVHIGGWHFKSPLDIEAQQQEFKFSLDELKAQEEKMTQTVKQLEEIIRRQGKLCSQFETKQFKVSINSSSYNSK